MKKFRVVITSAKDVKLLNDKIAIDSLFTVGETITNNPLHIGENIFSDKRIFDSVKEYTFNGTQPAVLHVYDGYPGFDESTYLIRVPESAIDTYKAADIWNWRRSVLNYDYYILDTDNNKVLDY